ncbi:ATP phosphoribosyltransferase [Capsaspora owczarzaki ATCC 30864]|nr:ATP phosphoribosyltransferase [Capsaspora owczarzaki ATCC 30864]|eukprot:XP_004346675.2 ATP phosphoribosyltransferase [Capsaspora owczarzaki ATCC 30864]
MVQESNVDVQELLQLGFGKCKLCVQAPIKSNIKNPKDLCGKRIVTSFPTLAAKYFKELDPTKTTSIHYVSGSVEAACALGLADGIVDLVETGDTMRAAGLEVVSEIMTTEALLVANPHTAHKELVDTFRKRIAGALTAERHVMIEYNVERARLAEAVKITPGKKSPTLSPLDDANWVAVKCLILLSESNTKMDQLEKIGARDILIYNIHNCRVSNE